jgi:hypothetical protein
LLIHLYATGLLSFKLTGNSYWSLMKTPLAVVAITRFGLKILLVAVSIDPVSRPMVVVVLPAAMLQCL